MERAFMGLRPKQPVNDDEFQETEVEWPCSTQVSALPSFMPFGVPQDDKTNKIGNDAVIPSASRPVSAAEIPDAMTFLASCQLASLSITNSLFRNPFAAAVQNSSGTHTKPPLFGGIPIASPHSVLPTTFTGFTDPRIRLEHVLATNRNGMARLGSPQLTIFYGGTVNVINDITPEKARAVMLFARNGSSSDSVMANHKVQVEEPNSSFVSVSSNSGTKSEDGCSSGDKPVATKPANAMGSFCAATMIPSIPQARKASLARFLEKRKERIMNAAPYNTGKKFLEWEAGESSGMNYSATS